MLPKKFRIQRERTVAERREPWVAAGGADGAGDQTLVAHHAHEACKREPRPGLDRAGRDVQRGRCPQVQRSRRVDGKRAAQRIEGGPTPVGVFMSLLHEHGERLQQHQERKRDERESDDQAGLAPGHGESPGAEGNRDVRHLAHQGKREGGGHGADWKGPVRASTNGRKRRSGRRCPGWRRSQSAGRWARLPSDALRGLRRRRGSPRRRLPRARRRRPHSRSRTLVSAASLALRMGRSEYATRAGRVVQREKASADVGGGRRSHCLTHPDMTKAEPTVLQHRQAGPRHRKRS